MMGNSNEENHDGFRQYRISVKAGLKTQKSFSPYSSSFIGSSYFSVYPGGYFPGRNMR